MGHFPWQTVDKLPGRVRLPMSLSDHSHVQLPGSMPGVPLLLHASWRPNVRFAYTTTPFFPIWVRDGRFGVSLGHVQPGTAASLEGDFHD